MRPDLNVCIFIVILSLICTDVYAKTAVQAKEIKVTEVIYPPAQSSLDKRDQDFIEILSMALKKTESTDGPFVIRPTKVAMNPLRFHRELEKNNEPNIIWASVTKQREERFLPIRIPLRKGILGYRVFLINKSQQPRFSAITSVNQLKQLTAGQGATWLDSDILAANGFDVEVGFSYEGLFKMLNAGRFDYFPRGINEVYVELQQRKTQHPEIDVEKTILLYYPLPKYFFVNKNNQHLADRIERGLNMMIKDGSFDEIFMKYNKFYIDAIHLPNRRVFLIDNPFLPDTVPLNRKELWLHLF
ncbi:substrate-binding periplasmic protein [Vibrio quintilis]|uniref:Bacterial extracellular solute-binding proteins, family 3 n=1 Tax=Vibrio quintilis TaxID=1117707 RepID=A0A1M7Z0W2_9VIBR|nr:transporter substrate-binding domain-containing protein [Vibrio quintilis]SHO58504.1 Bacterial extracellular solute-binding proteins, family 3 [Vibrio quintilis]